MNIEKCIAEIDEQTKQECFDEFDDGWKHGLLEAVGIIRRHAAEHQKQSLTWAEQFARDHPVEWAEAQKEFAKDVLEDSLLSELEELIKHYSDVHPHVSQCLRETVARHKGAST